MFFDGFAVPSVLFCVVISFPLGQLTVISFVVKDKRKTRRDKPGQEKTRRGETIGYKRALDNIRPHKTTSDKTRQDKARQGKVRQGKARQGNTRQDKTRQVKTDKTI